ncbi:hypothetical protein ACIQZB_41500 [Streptomyces sp. NPDC097727]|uniref:hypothetical protein n=1 Tax=Streptomyces sp. NPDC097727 TaxID=3366092 RepID=UPI003817B4EE
MVSLGTGVSGLLPLGAAAASTEVGSMDFAVNSFVPARRSTRSRRSGVGNASGGLP